MEIYLIATSALGFMLIYLFLLHRFVRLRSRTKQEAGGVTKVRMKP